MWSDNPLFPNLYPVCLNCGDLGFSLLESGEAVECWKLREPTVRHNAPNAAAKMLRRSLFSLVGEKKPIEINDFRVARMLTGFTSDNPCKRVQILNAAFGTNTLRHFHEVIERLRKHWLLPVGSRKDEPSGYWIITDADDFAEWVSRAKAAPITQLTTIHRVAKRNFPIFAEQMELEFWNDVEGAR